MFGKFNKASSILGHDDSWPATIPSVMLSLWYSLSETTTTTTIRKSDLGNTQNGRTVLPSANLMADSESPDSYLSFLETVRLSHLVLACDREMDGQMDRRTGEQHGPLL